MIVEQRINIVFPYVCSQTMELRHRHEAGHSRGLIDGIATSPLGLGFITPASFDYYSHNCQVSRSPLQHLSYLVSPARLQTTAAGRSVPRGRNSGYGYHTCYSFSSSKVHHKSCRQFIFTEVAEMKSRKEVQEDCRVLRTVCKY